MKKQLRMLLSAMALTCWLASAAEIDGKWTAQVESKRGEVTQTLTLKANGSQLAGSMQGRRGTANISDGTINGSSVSFKVVRDVNGKTVTQQYKGTLAGNQLNLAVTGPRGGTREVVFKKAN
jgi:hypothetical protein